MPLSAIKAGNVVLSEQVAEQVIQYIQENRLHCGDRLPNEKELVAQLGVSRSTIREAMRSLRSRGIVVIRQGSGTYVADSAGVVEDPLGLAFRYDRNKTLADLLDIRFMIEPTIAAACAQRATPKQKREIRALAEDVERLIRRGIDHTEKDIEFHAAICKYADNELLSIMFSDVLYGIKIYQGLLKDRLLEKTIQRHQEIVQGIMTGDAQRAYTAVAQHLEDNRLAIMECVKEIETTNNLKGSKEDYEDRFYRIGHYGQAHGKEPAESGL